MRASDQQHLDSGCLADGHMTDLISGRCIPEVWAADWTLDGNLFACPACSSQRLSSQPGAYRALLAWSLACQLSQQSLLLLHPSGAFPWTDVTQGVKQQQGIDGEQAWEGGTKLGLGSIWVS